MEAMMRSKTLSSINFKRTAISAAVAAAMAAGGAMAATQTHQVSTVFSVNNLVGDYNGTTVGTLGNGSDPTILCGTPGDLPVPGAATCPTGEIAPGINHPQPFTDTKLSDMNGDPISATLYPIDSTFGFNVVPFAEAFDKERGDGIWGEGWVGDIKDTQGNVIGLAFSDAETDTFAVPSGLGTWCVGIGGGSVKCSTERFVVMEHLLTCHETIPYYNADPVTGEQAKLYDPTDPSRLMVDCADTKLDNNLLVLNDSNPLANNRLTGKAAYTKDGVLIPRINWAQPALDPADALTFLEANESTVLDDIAYGDDYSITAKDDGKVLYRWGNLIKRPNDIRVYARFATPLPWRQAAAATANGGKGYRVTKATLTINHLITNNPNDQIRPEDMENEGAIGRLPGYTVSGNKWLSDTDCYQGNGLFLPAGTVLRNGDFAIPTTTKPVAYTGDPYSWSEDLLEGFTNGWATTVDREPFEWAYDTNNDGVADGSVRSPDLIPVGATPLSGPRWRLTPNKFGQDVPGLEIPNVECAPPPYQKDLIKYEVGVPTTTVLNLLDWDPLDERSVDGESPLVWSNGWVVKTFNEGTVVNRDVTVVNPLLAGVTVNGAPVSRDFDLSIYVKGDRKPTAIYNATLQVEWDDNPNYVAP
jgi:hypothetical protein